MVFCPFIDMCPDFDFFLKRLAPRLHVAVHLHQTNSFLRCATYLNQELFLVQSFSGSCIGLLVPRLHVAVQVHQTNSFK